MDKDLLLVLMGGLVGLLSSLAAALLTHYLDGRRLRAQLQRENLLRHEERERENLLRHEERERENLLRHEERERENLLRREEREREDQLRRTELRRQTIIREADALWRDMERMRENLRHIPQGHSDKFELERRLAEWTRRRQNLLKEEHDFVYRTRGSENTAP